MDIVKFNKDSHLQRIKDSFFDEKTELSLSDFEKDLAARLKFLYYSRLKNRYSKEQSLELYMKDFAASRATAYRHYAMAMRLYGEIDSVDLAAERAILAEQYWFLYQMHLRDRNLDGAERVMNSYARLFNFAKSDEDFDIDKIAANSYKIVMDKLSKQLLENQLAKGIVDMNLKAEDVDFEEL